jgi:hypothetical protein
MSNLFSTRSSPAPERSPPRDSILSRRPSNIVAYYPEQTPSTCLRCTITVLGPFFKLVIHFLQSLDTNLTMPSLAAFEWTQVDENHIAQYVVVRPSKA